MRDRIYGWIKAEWIKLSGIMLLSLLNILALKPIYLLAGYVNTLFLLFGVISISFFLIREYLKYQKISIIYVIGINVIALINFLGSPGVIFGICLLWIRFIIFLIPVVLGLFIVWKAKTKIVKHFHTYLILSLFTVILNFGGLYESLYSMYFPYGQENFKIDQEMSWSQVVMPIDFIYYSSDAFFGTNISDVSIKYIDYMELHNDESIMANHKDKYEGAINIIQIAKILSLLESILFIVYISIIVMGAEGVTSEETS
ncbi:hypothetical protein KDN24_08530 [Bacillus sp. Bva_UNVM-123]|uniref:hypothetical protein n=1 Tax=Bacillus sp. Bva_UNVM-123 TaxID=2829798 RepID=UPI00391F37B1